MNAVQTLAPLSVATADTALAAYEIALTTRTPAAFETAAHALAAALRRDAALARSASRPRPSLRLVADNPAPQSAPKRSKAQSAPADHLCVKALAGALARVSAVIERFNTIPILSNVLLEAEGDTLRISATSLDMKASETIPAPGVGNWAATVPGKTLLDLIKKAKAGPIGFAVQEADTPRRGESDPSHVVTVTVGGLSSRLPGLPVGEFPRFLGADGGTESDAQSAHVVIDAEEWRETLKAILPFCSTDPTRYYLQGAFLTRYQEAGAWVTRLVATDGHKLMRHDFTSATFSGGLPKGDYQHHAGIIIPRFAVAWLAKHGPKEGAVEISVTGKPGCERVTVTAGDLTIATKVVDGSFPDYIRVIPSETGRMVIEGKADTFGPALNQLAAISYERSRSVALDVREGQLHGAVRVAHDQASTESPLPCRVTGEPVSVGFNAAFLTAVCGLAPSFDLHIQDNAGPAVARFPDLPNRVAVVMPLRV